MMPSHAISSDHNTRLVKQAARELGFDFCGIAPAEFLADEAPRLDAWLREGRHGEMQYMERYYDQRLDPRRLLEGAKSVISLLLNYAPHQPLDTTDNYKISKYAYGTDYHFVIKDKLQALLMRMRAGIGDIAARVFVDSAPVMDKVWAKRAGLGWVGKHSNLINRQMGSWFFIAEIVCDVPLAYDAPIGDYCGTCTRCIDACPTEAIYAPYQVDGSRCISYLTIELKNQIPTEFAGKMDDWIFGCDICQDVCPWNRFARPHNTPAFLPHTQLTQMHKADWEDLTEDIFREIFKKSAVKRTKFAGLQRNINFVKQHKPPAHADEAIKPSRVV